MPPKKNLKLGPPVSISDEGEPIDIFADDIDTWIEKDVRVVVAIRNDRIKRAINEARQSKVEYLIVKMKKISTVLIKIEFTGDG